MKTYIQVIANFAGGEVKPLAVISNGRRYDITEIIESRRLAAYVVGGNGIRFACKFGARLRYIWYDDYDMRWFVEPLTAVEKRFGK